MNPAQNDTPALPYRLADVFRLFENETGCWKVTVAADGAVLDVQCVTGEEASGHQLIIERGIVATMPK